jgi:arylsulfatase A-like enzyme
MTRDLTRREAVRILGGAIAGLPSLSSRGSAAVRDAAPPGAPNVLFIMTDDQRQDAMSAYGNTILRTPNMDRIAAGGVRFTEAFVTNSLCAPSRASLLTGLYSHAHGVITNGGGPEFYNQPGLRDDQVTFVHLLRQAGYHTALVGKWHLRSEPSGFDDWVIFPGQGAYHDPEMIANGMRLKMRGHADDVVGDQAITYLRQRPADKPFCLLYQFKSPHRSWMPAARFANAFEAVDVPAPRTFEDRLAGRPEALRRAEMAIADMPDFRDRGVSASLPVAERKRLNLEHLVKNYYRVLLSVDENVGRVLDLLDAEGLAANTVVVYTSDNGFFLGEHGLFDKRLMYEPSIRVPLLVRFPRRAKAGRVDSSHLVLNVDVAPTLLELAGVPVPSWMHGRSLAPLLRGESPPWRDAFLYEYYEYPAEHCARKNRGVRTDRWKLIHFWEQPEEWELYDLRSDPDETNNLAGRAEYARVMTSLRQRLGELRREVGDADLPGPPPVAAPCGNGVNTGYGPPSAPPPG